MQGVVKSYDPGSRTGVIVSDVLVDGRLQEFDLAADALDGSVFRMLRQGQRVVFVENAGGQATSLGFGSEADMATPGSQLDDTIG